MGKYYQGSLRQWYPCCLQWISVIYIIFMRTVKGTHTSTAQFCTRMWEQAQRERTGGGGPWFDLWQHFLSLSRATHWDEQSKRQEGFSLSPKWLSHSIAAAVTSCSNFFFQDRSLLTSWSHFFIFQAFWSILPPPIVPPVFPDVGRFFFLFPAVVLWSLCLLIVVCLQYLLLWAPFTTVCISVSHQSCNVTDANLSKITCAWCMQPENKHLFQVSGASYLQITSFI